MKQKSNVDITVLVPTKNEEITISRFIEWCFEGFENAKLTGEIILMDSSTDQTPKIALQKGAEVVQVSEKGLGIAYYKGREFINGRYVILGDADCTYDFRNLKPFLEKLGEGYELVVGNRFRGSIEKNSMPLHHQYFGSPATSFIFKHSLGIPTGDIHCGMRALTADLYRKLPFTELGWEYASEMIVSSRNLGAQICEVPIDFLKEPEGRISHQVRNGWLTPFKAGWGTLRVTASFSLDRLLLLPGALLATLGLALNFLLLSVSPETLEELGFGNLSSSIFTAISLVGFLLGGLGLMAHLIYYPKGKLIDYLARQRVVNYCFVAVVFGGLIALVSSVILFDKWKRGFFNNIASFTSDNLRFVGAFNVSITLFVGLAVVLMCSFLASYMNKLRNSANRDFSK
jgi:glycosyltransferase involved in cell wall biosynthesis